MMKCNKCTCTIYQLKKCSRCKSIYYCSQTCQRYDWQEHKKYCQSSSSSFPPCDLEKASLFYFLDQNKSSAVKQLLQGPSRFLSLDKRLSPSTHSMILQTLGLSSFSTIDVFCGYFEDSQLGTPAPKRIINMLSEFKESYSFFPKGHKCVFVLPIISFCAVEHEKVFSSSSFDEEMNDWLDHIISSVTQSIREEKDANVLLIVPLVHQAPWFLKLMDYQFPSLLFKSTNLLNATLHCEITPPHSKIPSPRSFPLGGKLPYIECLFFIGKDNPWLEIPDNMLQLIQEEE